MAEWWVSFYKESVGKLRTEFVDDTSEEPEEIEKYLVNEDVKQPLVFPDEVSYMEDSEERVLAESPTAQPPVNETPLPPPFSPPPNPPPDIVLNPPPPRDVPPPSPASEAPIGTPSPPPSTTPSPPSDLPSPVLSPPPPSPPPPSPPPPSPPSPPPGAPAFSPPPPSPPFSPPPPPTFFSPPSSGSGLFPPSSYALSPPPSSSGGGVSVGLVIGVAAGGGALAVALLAVMILCCCGYFFGAGKKEDSRKGSGTNSGATPLKGPGASSDMSGAAASDGYTPGISSVTGILPFGGNSGGSIGGGSAVGGFGSASTTGSFFSYAELIKATDNFAAHNLLGEGGFGKVFKGVLSDGRQVAVKVQNVGGGQGEREFMAEVDNLSRVHHKHLVTLLGYCSSTDMRLLVYEFVPNGTLEYALHKNSQPMEWSVRVKAAIGSARGIAYLHEDCQPRIFHRDIKSSNILLGPNFEALVADFGLAKLASDTFSHVSTRVMGTFGYLAPEYAMTGKLTDKSDVFSYGVVLLELITGRKPVDERNPPGEESLVEWARPLLSLENLPELVDPRLQGRFDKHQLERMIAAAGLCVRSSAAMRPRMSQVVRLLEGASDVEDITSAENRPGISRVYESEAPFGGTQDFDSEEYSREMRKHMVMQKNNQGQDPGLSTIQSSEFGGSNNNGVYLYSGSQMSTEMPASSRFGSGQMPSTEFATVPRPLLSGEQGLGQSQDFSERLQEGR